MSAVVVGVDPGGATTGVVVRQGDQLLAHLLVRRGRDPLDRYLESVVNAVGSIWRDPDLRAVESVTPPTGFKHGRREPINPSALIGVSAVYGALLLTWRIDIDHRDYVIVQPRRHGTAPLGSYPAGLVGEREKGGAGILRHCRAAWDIAGGAVGAHRTQTQLAAAAW